MRVKARAQVIVSVTLGKVRRAVVQLLLSPKFFHSLGFILVLFIYVFVLLFCKVALPVQVRKQVNFCLISNRLNTVQWAYMAQAFAATLCISN